MQIAYLRFQGILNLCMNEFVSAQEEETFLKKELVDPLPLVVGKVLMGAVGDTT